MKPGLVECGTCGSHISKDAHACPRCGRPRTTGAGVVVAIVVGLVAGLLILGWLLS